MSENYYELLKVSPRATVAEIVTAYHAARNAFSPDSIAVYSLFSAEDAQTELKKLEEAYFTLSNIDRRREYDRRLQQGTVPSAPASAPATAPSAPLAPVVRLVPTPAAPAAAPSPQPLPSTQPFPAPAFFPQPPYSVTPTAFPAAPSTPPMPPEGVTGAWMAQARERQGMTIEDVAQLTKIPARTIAAIETENLSTLPARVYLQGFLRNLARQYHMDATATIQTYLARIDSLKKGAA
ncbi:helix-turn-helix domain-containing protein [bacterium]|nr:helix-turn-helix domain-containing protein [bacterium]